MARSATYKSCWVALVAGIFMFVWLSLGMHTNRVHTNSLVYPLVDYTYQVDSYQPHWYRTLTNWRKNHTNEFVWYTLGMLTNGIHTNSLVQVPMACLPTGLDGFANSLVYAYQLDTIVILIILIRVNLPTEYPRKIYTFIPL